MNAGPFALLISEFNESWHTLAPELAVQTVGQKVEVEESHPLHGELHSLSSGRSASLPYFANADVVIWCTVAPDNDSLRQAIACLNAWVLPSFGGEKEGDGYVQREGAKGGLAAKIISASPDGYYRWRCPRSEVSRIFEKLRLRRSLEAVSPDRTRPPRPSLYELRARFAAALLVGDRDGAKDIIELLDSLQLETAINTQFMRIRLWHHFREHERIRAHPDLQHLLAQPLPLRVRAWIDEALAVEVPPPAQLPTTPTLTEIKPEAVPLPPRPSTWADWFDCVREGNKAAAEIFLQERSGTTTFNLSQVTIEALVANLEDLYLDDALRSRERNVILQGIAELLEEFVRESGFPRVSIGNFYLAVLRVWCALHAGTSIGQEHGHVLLEIASAVLQLNLEPDTVRQILEDWWKAKPTPSQLPYALDAIELLEREMPSIEATANLWLAAAGVILRSPDTMAPSDRDLWRRVGKRLGFDDETISNYLPGDTELGHVDPLAEAGLRHVAIVCMREQQARDAADQIQERTGAQVSIVISKTAGSETDHARTADVVLFVWLATSHAVFRAFDGFDRKRFCYVQGTGASSIVRSLERWTL